MNLEYHNLENEFYRGVGNNNDKGLLEFLVRMVENIVLGDINQNGVRDGGQT
jgi:hypothetical protein